LLWLLANRKQSQVDSQQDKQLKALVDLITMLQKRIDTLKK